MLIVNREIIFNIDILFCIVYRRKHLLTTLSVCRVGKVLFIDVSRLTTLRKCRVGKVLFTDVNSTNDTKCIRYSQALRFNRICSDNETFDGRCNQLEEWLLDRGYSSKLVLKAGKFSREDLLDSTKPNKSRKLTINIMNHPAFSKLKNILKTIHLLLSPDREHVDVSSQVPIVGFRRAKSLKYILVRTKLPLG